MKYANFFDIDIMPYRMIEKLINDGHENLWRLLKYDDIYALGDTVSHPYLTKAEKSNLIWIDQKQDDCRIFFTRTIEDQIPAEHTIIKIYNYKDTPLNTHTIIISWCWEILWGANQSVVYNEEGYPVNRGDLILYYIMDCLNGKHVGGVGDIAFASNRNSYAAVQSIIGNTTTYTGLMIILPTVVGGDGSCCE